nr:MAG: hypothetical protein [Cressdnaviricota sp.]
MVSTPYKRKLLDIHRQEEYMRRARSEQHPSNKDECETPMTPSKKPKIDWEECSEAQEVVDMTTEEDESDQESETIEDEDVNDVREQLMSFIEDNDKRINHLESELEHEIRIRSITEQQLHIQEGQISDLRKLLRNTEELSDERLKVIEQYLEEINKLKQQVLAREEYIRSTN